MRDSRRCDSFNLSMLDFSARVRSGRGLFPPRFSRSGFSQSGFWARMFFGTALLAFCLGLFAGCGSSSGLVGLAADPAPALAEIELSGSVLAGAGAYFIQASGRQTRVATSDWIADAALQIRAAAVSPDGLVSSGSTEFWKDRFRVLFAKQLDLPNGGRRLLLSVRNGGIISSDDDGRSWKRAKGVPRRFVPEDYSGPVLFRDVEDVWQNPRRPLHLLAVVKHRLLESNDGGLSFKGLPDTGVRSNYTSIAALVSEQGDLKEIYLGTSVNGIYRIFIQAGKYRRNGYKHCFRGLPYEKHDQSHWLFDEVVGLVVDQQAGRLYAAVRFEGLYEGNIPTNKSDVRFESLRPGQWEAGDNAHSLAFAKGSLVLSASRGVFIKSVVEKPGASQGWRFVEASRAFGDSKRSGSLLFAGAGRINTDPYVERPWRKTPGDIKAIYISPTTVLKRQRELFRLLDKYPFNAAVIDVKDDFGRLVYGSALPEAKDMGNHRKRVNLEPLIAKLKQRKMYLIARQVAFKDPRLYAYKNHAYAVVDRSSGRPWAGTDVERWVDTFSTYVQNYNIRVAREVLAMGFDEVQFDYIRFPSDGPVHRIRWRHRKGKAYKAEALEAFLRKARWNIDAPISTAIYGYNGMYRVEGRVGQDLLDLGEYVDAISPMHYSSHYGPLYLNDVARDKRTHVLMQTGTLRPRLMGAGRFAVRPWAQCFKLLTGRWGWGVPYMKAQIEGIREGGGSGVLWWGPLKLFYLAGEAHKELHAIR